MAKYTDHTTTIHISGSETGDTQVKGSTKTGAIGTISHSHMLVHQGLMFLISHVFSAVANDGFADFAIITGAEDLHLVFKVTAGGESLSWLYEGATFSDNGTEVTPTNVKFSSTEVLESNFYYTPTISDNGTEKFQGLIEAGSGPKSAGSDLRPDEELMLKPNTNYLIRIQNKAVGDIYVGIEMVCYE